MATRTTRLTLKTGIEETLLSKVLCYPKPSQEELYKRLKQLRALDIEELILEGPHKIDGFNVIGKGCDSLVVKALLKDRVIALKIRRVDSHVKTLLPEGENQKIANGVNVGAKVYAFSEDFIAMELIEGIHIDVFIRQASQELIAVVIRDLLEQCRRLDLIGLDHGELSRAHKHIIVTTQAKPVIIDFSSSSKQRRPSNVSSVFSFLFLSKIELSHVLCQKLNVSFARDVAIKALREYKRTLSEESFKRILELVALK